MSIEETVSKKDKQPGLLKRTIASLTAAAILAAAVCGTGSLGCTSDNRGRTPTGVTAQHTGHDAGFIDAPYMPKDTAAAPGDDGTSKTKSGDDPEKSKEGCVKLPELRVNMKFDSTKLVDQTDKADLEQYVKDAAKAGHKIVYITGFASLENKGDRILNDHAYNMRLAEARAEAAAKYVQGIINKNNLGLTVLIKDYAETAAFGKDINDLAPNRNIMLTLRPLEDPDKNPVLASTLRSHAAGEIYTRDCTLPKAKTKAEEEKTITGTVEIDESKVRVGPDVNKKKGSDYTPPAVLPKKQKTPKAPDAGVPKQHDGPIITPDGAVIHWYGAEAEAGPALRKQLESRIRPMTGNWKASRTPSAGLTPKPTATYAPSEPASPSAKAAETPAVLRARPAEAPAGTKATPIAKEETASRVSEETVSSRANTYDNVVSLTDRIKQAEPAAKTEYNSQAYNNNRYTIPAALHEKQTSAGVSYAEVLREYMSASSDRLKVSELKEVFGLDEVLKSCPVYKGARSSVDAEERAARRELAYAAKHEDGMSVSEIAESLGVSKSTIYRDLKAQEKQHSDLDYRMAA